MASQPVSPPAVPDHVPDVLVHDLDIFEFSARDEDPHLAMIAMARTMPEIFWTPRNGGHWVAVGADAVEAMIVDHERFTSECFFVPKKPPEAVRELPIECDPPKHTRIRRPLTKGLLPTVINEQEASIRGLATSLIDGLIDRGECEFISEFAQIFPICVFLDLVQLPREDREILIPITKKVVGGRTPEIRHEGIQELVAYLLPVIRARRETPGKDLLSPLVNVEEEQGRRLDESDALSYANTVLFAGLDTVAAMLSLVTRFLALNPDHRRELTANLQDATFVRNALEELLRRHGIAAVGRVAGGDFTYRGVEFRKGDSLILMPAMVGIDPRRNHDPAEVDFARGDNRSHLAFGGGIHTCPGNILARRELRVFLEEWLTRIPDFSIAPGTVPQFATGYVMGLTELKLVWPTNQGKVLEQPATQAAPAAG